MALLISGAKGIRAKDFNFHGIHIKVSKKSHAKNGDQTLDLLLLSPTL